MEYICSLETYFGAIWNILQKYKYDRIHLMISSRWLRRWDCRKKMPVLGALTRWEECFCEFEDGLVWLVQKCRWLASCTLLGQDFHGDLWPGALVCKYKSASLCGLVMWSTAHGSSLLARKWCAPVSENHLRQQGGVSPSCLTGPSLHWYNSEL